MGMGVEIRQRIAKRAALEIRNGMVVNLGIGIPSLVQNYIDPALQVFFHAENGILGMGASPIKGEEDENLCNAAGYPTTLVRGGSYFDSATAFGMIRRGKLDMTILGSLQVSENGDLANWIVPNKRVPGIGGAMELAAKAKKVIVLMNHNDKNGASKIVKSCTLPLTAKSCVDMIITELGVFNITDKGVELIERLGTESIHEIQQRTAVPLRIGKK
ncbi:MAG: 3-oxoacid CoA-transferase subunit B [Bacillaceae bacterium]